MDSRDQLICLEEIEAILFRNEKFVLKETDLLNVQKSFVFLKQFSEDKIIYGINTGFGPMAQYRIDNQDLRDLQYNIVRSHACGTGQPLKEIYVKAAMIARCVTFLAGKSGVHLDTVRLLVEMINRNINPYIPQHGSVGASGDLVQLSHIALTLIGEGEVFHHKEKRPTAEVFAKEGLEPLQLQLRDGLALVNGTAVMTGIAFVNHVYAQKLMNWAVITSTLINEIVDSYDDFIAKPLTDAKLHDGQRMIAYKMRSIASKSKRLRNRQEEFYSQKHDEQVFNTRLQPYYSLRCVPQILGVAEDELAVLADLLEKEFNSVDDNPIIDPQTQNVYHGGNFHGDYIAFAMDKLKIAVTKMTMLAERQLNYLLHDRINETLPPFVNLGKLGLNYGMQGAQFTATSTTAENQTLSNPMYVHSIPNNNDNQDIVSMGTNAALLAARVIDNAFEVMAIYSIALVQAVDCLKIKDELATATVGFYEQIRNIIPVFSQDKPKYKDIEVIIDYLKS